MTADAVPIAFVRACKKCLRTKKDCPTVISVSKAKEARFSLTSPARFPPASRFPSASVYFCCVWWEACVCVCVLFCLARPDLSLVCFQVFLLSDADLRACPSVKVDGYMLFTKKDTSSNGAAGSASEPKQMSVRNNEFFILLLYVLLLCSDDELGRLSTENGGLSTDNGRIADKANDYMNDCIE